MRHGWAVMGLLASVLAAPCVHAESANPEPYSESGTATFYRSSRIFHRTSTGEIFNENALTAAHPTLPMGTMLKVTCQDSGRSIVVRVNDRSASSNIERGRVIDLSYGAAKRLGIHGMGDVTLTEVTDSADQAQAQALPVDSYKPGQVVPPEAEEVAEAPDDAAPVRHPRHRVRHHLAPSK